MIVLGVDGISLSFGVTPVLQDISFSVADNDKLGIVGVNGAGKTSLLRIITGEYKADSGNIHLTKDGSLSYIKQDAFNNSNLTVLEEAHLVFDKLWAMEERLHRLEGLFNTLDPDSRELISAIDEYDRLSKQYKDNGGLEYENRTKEILRSLSLDERFWDMPVVQLSGGQKTRLALSKLLLSEPDVMLLDEPTNHLDLNSLTWLEKFIKDYRKAVIIVSHDRYFLDATTNKILDIENHKARIYDGNYSAYTAKKASDREIQEKRYNEQQREIKRIEGIIEQQLIWAKQGKKQAKTTAESKQKQLDRIERIDKVEAPQRKIKLAFKRSTTTGNDVLAVDSLKKEYPGKPLFSDVSFSLKKGENVFIIGPNGCGKSTMVKILCGNLQQDKGDFNYGYNIKLGYYDQEHQGLNDKKTVIDEIWDDFPELTQTQVRTTLGMFLFRGDDVQKPVSILSGGERARLTLTKLLLEENNVLVLDEPTNHLDINSREALENALETFDGTILCVSHDRYFINKLSTRILDLSDNKFYDYRGKYEDYLIYKERYLDNANAADAELSTASQSAGDKESFIAAKQEKSKQKRNERLYAQTQTDIAAAEARIDVIDAEMASDEVASNYERVHELFEEKYKLEDKLIELYELFEELEGLQG